MQLKLYVARQVNYMALGAISWTNVLKVTSLEPFIPHESAALCYIQVYCYIRPSMICISMWHKYILYLRLLHTWSWHTKLNKRDACFESSVCMCVKMFCCGVLNTTIIICKMLWKCRRCAGVQCEMIIKGQKRKWE